MKNKKMILVGIIVSIGLLVVVFLFCNTTGAELAEGTYKITDCEEYPEAYIIVKGENVQFYNIDLNAIYQEGEIEQYNKVIEKGFANELTQEQLDKEKDLNNLFVNNKFDLNYKNSTKDNKQGTFSYVYFCHSPSDFFGFVLEYDALHKTIQVNSPIRTLVFKK